MLNNPPTRCFASDSFSRSIASLILACRSEKSFGSSLAEADIWLAFSTERLRTGAVCLDDFRACAAVEKVRGVVERRMGRCGAEDGEDWCVGGLVGDRVERETRWWKVGLHVD